MPFIPDNVQQNKFGRFVPDDEVQEQLSSGKITSEQFKNRPIKTTFQALMQPVRQSVFGESTEQINDRTVPLDEYSKRLNPEAPGFVNELGKTSIIIDEFGRRMTREAADAIQNPLNYVIGPVVKGGAKIITKGVQMLPEGLKKSSYGLMNSIVRQLPKEFRYGQNAGRGAVREKITGFSADDIAQKAQDKLTAIGKEGDTLASSVNSIDDYSKAIKIIDDKIDDLILKTPNVNKSAIKRLQDSKDDLLGIKRDADGAIIKQRIQLSNMTPKQALDFKRDYDNVTKWSGTDADDKIVNVTLQASRRSIKDQLNRNVPGLKEWNDRYGDLYVLKKAAERESIYQESRNSLRTMANNFLRAGGLGTAATSALTGNIDLAINTLKVLVAKEALTSPIAKSNLAKFLYNLSEIDKAKIFKAIPLVQAQYRQFMSGKNVKQPSNPINENVALKGLPVPKPLPKFIQDRMNAPIENLGSGELKIYQNPISMTGEKAPLRLPAPKAEQPMPQYLKERQNIPVDPIPLKAPELPYTPSKEAIITKRGGMLSNNKGLASLGGSDYRIKVNKEIGSIDYIGKNKDVKATIYDVPQEKGSIYLDSIVSHEKRAGRELVQHLQSKYNKIYLSATSKEGAQMAKDLGFKMTEPPVNKKGVISMNKFGGFEWSKDKKASNLAQPIKEIIKSPLGLTAATGIGIAATMKSANAKELKYKKVNPAMKIMIAKAENAGNTKGDWAQLEDIVLQDLKQIGKLDKNITLKQVKSDPELYDHVSALYLERLNDFGIPENKKALWWLLPGRYKTTGGDLNKLKPEFKNIMENRVKNMSKKTLPK